MTCHQTRDACNHHLLTNPAKCVLCLQCCYGLLICPTRILTLSLKTDHIFGTSFLLFKINKCIIRIHKINKYNKINIIYIFFVLIYWY